MLFFIILRGKKSFAILKKKVEHDFLFDAAYTLRSKYVFK